MARKVGTAFDGRRSRSAWPPWSSPHVPLKPSGGGAPASPVNPTLTSGTHADQTNAPDTFTLVYSYAGADTLVAYGITSTSGTAPSKSDIVAGTGTGTLEAFVVDPFSVATFNLTGLTSTSESATHIHIYLAEKNNGGESAVVTGTVTGLDFTLPAFSSAATDVAGDTITITTTESVSGTPATGDFSFSGISAGTPTIDSVVVSGASITIEISGNLVANGDTVTVSYTKGGSVIRDGDGNEMASFSAQAVTNNVPAGATYPQYLDGDVSSDNTTSETTKTFSLATTGYNGTDPILVFCGGHMDAGSQSVSGVTINGDAMTVVASEASVATGFRPCAAIYGITGRSLPNPVTVVVTYSGNAAKGGAALYARDPAKTTLTPTAYNTASTSINMFTNIASGSDVIGSIMCRDSAITGWEQISIDANVDCGAGETFSTASDGASAGGTPLNIRALGDGNAQKCGFVLEMA